jgi:hypothetical protein
MEMVWNFLIPSLNHWLCQYITPIYRSDGVPNLLNWVKNVLRNLWEKTRAGLLFLQVSLRMNKPEPDGSIRLSILLRLYFDVLDILDLGGPVLCDEKIDRHLVVISVTWGDGDLVFWLLWASEGGHAAPQNRLNVVIWGWAYKIEVDSIGDIERKVPTRKS